MSYLDLYTVIHLYFNKTQQVPGLIESSVTYNGLLLQVDRLICHLCDSIETKLMRCIELAPFKAEDCSDDQKVSQRIVLFSEDKMYS